MREFPREILEEVGTMLAGYERAHLEAKMEMVCRVTQFLLEKGYEDLWVSVCSGPNDTLLNMAIIQSDLHAEALEQELIDDAESVHADSKVVVNDAWWVSPGLFDPSGADLSVHPERRESLVVTAIDRSKHLTGMKPFVRTGSQLVFGDLIIKPACDREPDYQQFATAAYWR